MTKKKNGATWDRYREAVAMVWETQNMRDYCIKKTDFLVELSDGSLYAVDKESIETSFCFGYGYCGISTEEDSDRAGRMVDKVKNDGGAYFIEKNMKGIEDTIRYAEDNAYDMFLFRAYTGQPDGCPITSYEMVRKGANGRPHYSGMLDYRQASDEDRQKIIAGLRMEAEAFKKRLDTYLKRYGTSKLHSWSYLSD